MSTTSSVTSFTTFFEVFCQCAERWPDHPAVEIQRSKELETYSYAKLRDMAISLAGWLISNGYKPGTRVAILAENHPRWVAAYLGIIAAECTAVPLDTALHADQVAKLLGDSGSSLLFSDAKHESLAQQAVANQSVRLERIDNGASHQNSANGSLHGIFNSTATDPLPVVVSPDSLASLLYTSGTTADPKGVMITHANLMGEVDAVFAWADLGVEDAVLGVLPLFHVLSQMANILLPLVRGSRVVFLETLNTTELLRALRERRITAFAVVPQFFYLIHEKIFKEVAKRGKLAVWGFRALMQATRFFRALGWNSGKVFFRSIHQLFGDRMRYLVTGGSHFDPQIGRDFYRLGIDVLQAYGLTETTGGAFATPPRKNVIGSVGPPLKGVESKIFDPQPQENGQPAVGEILIRGAIVMKGYWNRPDATAVVLKDGWLYTGDLGYFDADGNLFITGRKKEVIILSNGKNIYPEEIETHYLKSPYIQEICVLGIERSPGDPASEQLYAVVVPNFEVMRERKVVNAKEVLRYDIEGLSVPLPSTKRVSGYEIWQENLPRTTTRKLKRFEIEKRVKEGKRWLGGEALQSKPPLSEEDTEWTGRPEVQRALRVIREASNRKPETIRPDDNLELDLGFDSIQRVELLVALEQELGSSVEESKLSEIYTVRQLVDLAVAERTGSAQPHVVAWQTVLQEEPQDRDVLKLAQPGRPMEAVWYLFTRPVQLLAFDSFNLKVTGLEKLPARGPFIICSNHQSYIDGIIFSSLLPWRIFRDLFFVGTSEVFGTGFMRNLARWLRVMVVDPDANLVPAMRAAAFGLRHRRVLILYPEGERSLDGPPKTFKKGAAILSIHTQAPIVPVAIEGFHEAWPRGRRFQKFAPLKIAIGDPIFPPPPSEAFEKTYAQLTAELRKRVLEMWQPLHNA